jgi:hypothetical protein
VAIYQQLCRLVLRGWYHRRSCGCAIPGGTRSAHSANSQSCPPSYTGSEFEEQSRNCRHYRDKQGTEDTHTHWSLLKKRHTYEKLISANFSRPSSRLLRISSRAVRWEASALSLFDERFPKECYPRICALLSPDLSRHMARHLVTVNATWRRDLGGQNVCTASPRNPAPMAL